MSSWSWPEADGPIVAAFDPFLPLAMRRPRKLQTLASVARRRTRRGGLASVNGQQPRVLTALQDKLSKACRAASDSGPR